MRKTKSVAELINAKPSNLHAQSVSMKQGQENLSLKVKPTKMEPMTGKAKIKENTAAKPPVIPANDEHGRASEQSLEDKECSKIVTPCQAEPVVEKCVNLNTSRISPLSNNGANNEFKIEGERERKTKVRFQTEIVCPPQADNTDLSETQTIMEGVALCAKTELQKENYQPQVRRLFTFQFSIKYRVVRCDVTKR